MKKNILIGVLVLVILGLGGYIFYDKVYSKNNNIKEEVSKDENNIEDQDNKIDFDISYKDEVYTTKNNAGYVVSTSKRNLPVINSSKNQFVADKIVLSLTGISDKEWNGNIKSTADEMVDMAKDATEDMKFGVNYLFTTGIYNDNRLTFKLEMNGSFGGVTWPGESGYNYDVKSGDMLKLYDISSDYDNFMNVLKVNVENYLKSGNDMCLVDDYSSKLENLINTDGNWYFTDRGIRVVFPKYSIACGSAGIIGIDIDKSLINYYIKDEYKV